jgi:hypothetical protein
VKKDTTNTPAPDFLGWRVYFGSGDMELRTAFRLRAALKGCMPGAKVIIHSGPHPGGLMRIKPATGASTRQVVRAKAIATAAIKQDLQNDARPKTRPR